jgi:hypothetical protein
MHLTPYCGGVAGAFPLSLIEGGWVSAGLFVPCEHGNKFTGDREKGAFVLSG